LGETGITRHKGELTVPNSVGDHQKRGHHGRITTQELGDTKEGKINCPSWD